MIQPNELRIGNFVSYYLPTEDKPEISAITAIADIAEWGLPDSPDKCYCVFFSNRTPINLNGIMPVPLTVDIVEGAGFEMVLNVQRGRVSALPSDYIKGDFVINAGHHEWWYWSAPLNTRIDYVHQLQNLYYALTGTELTIDLNKKP